MVKILFYEPYALAPPVWGTCLEVMQDLLDAGNEVMFVGCEGRLAACAYNLSMDPATCHRCIRNRDAGLNALVGETLSFTALTRHTERDREILRSLKTRHRDIDELKAYRFEGYDVGMAVASTLISHQRNHRPDVAASLSDTVARLLRASAGIYLSLDNHLRDYRPDAAYTFNGRLDGTRPLVRLAQKYRLPFFVCELGAGLISYDILENMLPHDMHKIQQRIDKHWDAADPSRREAVVHESFRRKCELDPTRLKAFISKQRSGQLPEDFDPGRRNLVFFHSSDDEFAAVDTGESGGLFDNQFEAVHAVENICRRLGEDVVLYLRLHPNLSPANPDMLQQWLGLESRTLRVIGPDSPVDSYTLLRNADVCLAFGSTMGSDAGYFDKPSILLGRSYYSELGSVYIPRTLDELSDLLSRETLAPLPRTGAMKYTYYLNTFGIPYRIYQPGGECEGVFRQAKLSSRPTLGDRIRALLHPSSIAWQIKCRLALFQPSKG